MRRNEDVMKIYNTLSRRKEKLKCMYAVLLYIILSI